MAALRLDCLNKRNAELFSYLSADSGVVSSAAVAHRAHTAPSPRSEAAWPVRGAAERGGSAAQLQLRNLPLLTAAFSQCTWFNDGCKQRGTQTKTVYEHFHTSFKKATLSVLLLITLIDGLDSLDSNVFMQITGK